MLINYSERLEVESTYRSNKEKAGSQVRLDILKTGTLLVNEEINDREELNMLMSIAN